MSDGIWVDVRQFRGLLGDCREHGHDDYDTCALGRPALGRAVALYRGEFLAGFTLKDSAQFDDWQRAQTETLRAEADTASERLVRCLRAGLQWEEAILRAQRWLELDRCNEAAHRCLMGQYAECGRRAAALRQYEECVRVLREELAVRPGAETVRLFVERAMAARPRWLWQTISCVG